MSNINKTSEINQTFIIEPIDGLGILSACTGFYSNNILSCTGNTSISLGNNVISFNGSILGVIISGSTFYGDGSHLTGILNQDTTVTGGTYSNGTTIFRNNTGGTFSISGYSTGYTLSSSGITTALGYVPYNSNNPNNYISGITSSNVITALGYIPLSAYTDITVTGGTYSAGTAEFRNNTGGTFSVTGFTSSTGNTVPTLQEVTAIGNDTTNELISYHQVSALDGDTGHGTALSPVDGILLAVNDGGIAHIKANDVFIETDYMLPNKSGITQTFAMLSDLTYFTTGQTLQQVTNFGNTTTNLINTDGGYIFNNGDSNNSGKFGTDNGSYREFKFKSTDSSLNNFGSVLIDFNPEEGISLLKVDDSGANGGLTVQNSSIYGYLNNADNTDSNHISLLLDGIETDKTIYAGTGFNSFWANTGRARFGTQYSSTPDNRAIDFYSRGDGSEFSSGLTVSFIANVEGGIGYSYSNNDFGLSSSISLGTGFMILSSNDDINGNELLIYPDYVRATNKIYSDEMVYSPIISGGTYLNLPIDIRVTGGTYSNGTTVFTNNTGGTFSVTGFSTGTTSGTDIRVTGGTYNNSTGISTFTNNTGGTFSVTGFSTGYTLTSGAISTALGYIPLSAYTDTFITGGTHTLSAGTSTFRNSTGGTFSVTGYYTGYTPTTDIRVTGGTHILNTGTSLFTNNTGGTFSVTDYYTGYTLTSGAISTTLGYVPLSAYTDTTVTGGTYSNGTTIFRNNTGGTFSVTGYSTFTGITSSNVISALGYTPASTATTATISAATSANTVSLTGKVPYTGASGNVLLGTNTLVAKTLQQEGVGVIQSANATAYNNGIFIADPTLGAVSIGDYGNVVNNTYLSVNDATRELVINAFSTSVNYGIDASNMNVGGTNRALLGKSYDGTTSQFDFYAQGDDTTFPSTQTVNIRANVEEAIQLKATSASQTGQLDVATSNINIGVSDSNTLQVSTIAITPDAINNTSSLFAIANDNYISGFFKIDDVGRYVVLGDFAINHNGTTLKIDDDNLDVSIQSTDTINLNTNSLQQNGQRVLTVLDAPIKGQYTTTGTATVSFVVTIGQTMANTSYVVLTEAQNLLSSPVHWISAKTTTTFTVTYATGLTGAVAFDWVVFP